MGDWCFARGNPASRKTENVEPTFVSCSFMNTNVYIALRLLAIQRPYRYHLDCEGKKAHLTLQKREERPRTTVIPNAGHYIRETGRIDCVWISVWERRQGRVHPRVVFPRPAVGSHVSSLALHARMHTASREHTCANKFPNVVGFVWSTHLKRRALRFRSPPAPTLTPTRTTAAGERSGDGSGFRSRCGGREGRRHGSGGRAKMVSLV